MKDIDNETLKSEIVLVLKDEPLDSFNLRMKLRTKLALSKAPFIDSMTRKLRESGLIYFGKDRKWHHGNITPCVHCNGTGFMRNQDAKGNDAGAEESSVEKNQEDASADVSGADATSEDDL